MISFKRLMATILCACTVFATALSPGITAHAETTPEEVAESTSLPEASLASISAIRGQIASIFPSALTSSGKKSFSGYCAAYVNHQLNLLGINKTFVGGNANQEFSNYSNLKKTSGGYYVFAYPSSKYTLASALDALTNYGMDDVYNVLVCFGRGSATPNGQTYGHAFFIHAIIDGIAYYSESFDTTINGTYYPEGSVIAVPASQIPKSYARRVVNRNTIAYDFDGIICFSKTQTLERSNNTNVVTRNTSATGNTSTPTEQTYSRKFTTNTSRISGSTRVDTAIAISKASYKFASNMVLVSGNDYPDALASVPLAHALNAPMLLVTSNSLQKSVKAEIERLGVGRVYIVGGESAVSKTVSDDIEAMGIEVVRISGNNRFATSTAIAEQLRNIVGAPTEVFLAYAYNYPDALSISVVAARKNSPLLYVDGEGNFGSNEETVQRTERFLRECNVQNATIVGGPTVISYSAEMNLYFNDIFDVVRIFGADKYQTCVNINREYADILNESTIYAASGDNYADALVGGVLAAKANAPLLLVGKNVSYQTTEYIVSAKPQKICVLGGKSSIPENAESKLKCIYY